MTGSKKKSTEHSCMTKEFTVVYIPTYLHLCEIIAIQGDELKQIYGRGQIGGDGAHASWSLVMCH